MSESQQSSLKQNTNEPPTTNSKSNFAQRQAERMRKLRSLHTKRNESRTQNHHEVVAEDARLKMPANWEARKERAEWLLQDSSARDECRARGVDHDRIKLLEVSATDADRIERKRRSKAAPPDEGFSDFQAATVRQHTRLVNGLAPKDMEAYEREKLRYGDAFYGGKDVIVHGMHKDRPEAIDGMVKSLEAQIAKRAKYSRRRTHNDDADIDYINERNAKFNKKLDHYYGEYTAEIKQNLERGTAV